MGISNHKNYNRHDDDSILLEHHNHKSNNISKEFIDIPYYLSLSTLIIKPDNKPYLSGNTLVLNNGQQNWRMTFIIHKKIANYIDNNKSLIQILFKDKNQNNRNILQSKLSCTIEIENTDFVSYSTCCNCPVKYTTILNIYFALENHEHQLFNITAFKYDDEKSHYKIFTEGLNKFNEEEFTKYWSLCIENYSNISKVTHYIVSKNNINEEHILNDPWFALFSICEDDDTNYWIDQLKLLNSDVNWKKLCEISRNFYKKYKYEPKHIRKSLQRLLSTIGYSASLIDHIDINIIGNMCQKISEYIKKYG